MNDPIVVSVAGTAITIGMVVSFLTQYLKIKSLFQWVPDAQRAVAIRFFVVVVCVAVNYIVIRVQGQAFDMTQLSQTVVSYLTASAAYDHLWKS